MILLLISHNKNMFMWKVQFWNKKETTNVGSLNSNSGKGIAIPIKLWATTASCVGCEPNITTKDGSSTYRKEILKIISKQNFASSFYSSNNLTFQNKVKHSIDRKS